MNFLQLLYEDAKGYGSPEVLNLERDTRDAYTRWVLASKVDNRLRDSQSYLFLSYANKCSLDAELEKIDGDLKPSSGIVVVRSDFKAAFSKWKEARDEFYEAHGKWGRAIASAILEH